MTLQFFLAIIPGQYNFFESSNFGLATTKAATKGGTMAGSMAKWTEEQVVEAFNNFRNKNAGESVEAAEATLRKHLRKLGKGMFDSDDILAVAGMMVPGHCVIRLADVVIDWLNGNVQPTIDVEFQVIE